MGLETLMADSVPAQTQSSQIPWEHEDASVMLIDYTYDQLGDQMDQIGLTKSDIKLIQELIKGDSTRYK